MSYGISHRCLTIVMQRMCCQRSTLRVGNSCCIMLYPCSDGAPQRCQWMPLCSVALSPHVLSLAKYLTMAFEKIPKIQIPPNYHLSCHSSVHMTHSKSPNNFPPRLFFHSLCIRSSLHSTPCRPHRPVPGPLAIAVSSIHGGARSEEPLHRGGVAEMSRPVQRCPTSAAEGLGDVNGWRAPPRGSPPPTPTLYWERLESVEWSPWVSSFSKLYSELVQWQPLSLLVFVKTTKTRNWWNLPQQKIWKRENRFLTPKKTYLNTSQAFSSALSHPYSSRPN